MKILALIISAIAVTALVAVQHQRLGQLRAENATLQQASTEADQLKADLDKSSGAEANAEDEIARLREENRDLLKLRNQVYQLRQATAQFQQVSAQNQRLESIARNPGDAKDTAFQPAIILIRNLYNVGLNTPEAAAETFFWAERSGSEDALSHCIVPERWSQLLHGNDLSRMAQGFDNIISIEIAARRDLDPNTVQLGVAIHRSPDWSRKLILTFRLRNGEWKLDTDSLES